MKKYYSFDYLVKLLIKDSNSIIVGNESKVKLEVEDEYLNQKNRYKEGMKLIRTTLAEFIFELYLKDDQSCSNLYQKEKDIITEFLQITNKNLAGIKLEDDDLAGANFESKLYLYRVIQMFDKIFVHLKLTRKE
jgi:hypothetical protein